MSEPQKRPAYEPADRLLTRPSYDPGMRRPVTTVAGAALVLLRVASGVIWTFEFAQKWAGTGGDADAAIDGVALDPEIVRFGLGAIIVISGTALIVEAVMAGLIHLGRNVARVIVMWFAVLSIAAAFVGWWAEGQEITLRTSLLSLALDILILLALSSRSAAAYARRNEGGPRRSSRRRARSGA